MAPFSLGQVPQGGLPKWQESKAVGVIETPNLAY